MVRFHDDFPCLTAMLGVDGPSAIYDIPAIPHGPMEHSPEIDLREASVLHPLEKMGAEFQLPVPPFRPRWTTQSLSPPCPCMLRGAVGSCSLTPVHLYKSRFG